MLKEQCTKQLHLLYTPTGGLGDLAYPLVADLKKEISEAYGVLSDEGIALRGLFLIDKEGVVQHATINNLAFGRSVDETLRTLQVRGSITIYVHSPCLGQ